MRSYAFHLGGADAKDADNVDKEDSVEIVHDDGDADADAINDADDDNADNDNSDDGDVDNDADNDADDADAAATATDKEVINAMSCPDDGAEENIPLPGNGIVTMQFAWRWDRPGSDVDEVEWRRLLILIEPPGRCRCR